MMIILLVSNNIIIDCIITNFSFVFYLCFLSAPHYPHVFFSFPSVFLTETLSLNFSVNHQTQDNMIITRELCPDGLNINLTRQNWHKYERLILDYYLHLSFSHSFISLFEGFMETTYNLPLEFMENIDDLEMLICGNCSPNWKDLKTNAVYIGWLMNFNHSHFRSNHSSTSLLPPTNRNSTSSNISVSRYTSQSEFNFDYHNVYNDFGFDPDSYLDDSLTIDIYNTHNPTNDYNYHPYVNTNNSSNSSNNARAHHPTIRFFWQYFDSLSNQEKLKFWKFISGCDRIPIEGLSTISMKINEISDRNYNKLPEARVS
jgi:hypothetical protein